MPKQQRNDMKKDNQGKVRVHPPTKGLLGASFGGKMLVLRKDILKTDLLDEKTDQLDMRTSLLDKRIKTLDQ